MLVQSMASFKLSRSHIPRNPVSSSSSFLNAALCHLLSVLWKSPMAKMLRPVPPFPRTSVPHVYSSLNIQRK